MSNKLVSVGNNVVFNPENLEDYTLDGVNPGDKGVVTYVDNEDDEVVVNFTRRDGTLCEGFFCFEADVEVIDD